MYTGGRDHPTFRPEGWAVGSAAAMPPALRGRVPGPAASPPLWGYLIR
jgi:hypothetical protein